MDLLVVPIEKPDDLNVVELATKNALAAGAGHSFFVFLRDGFPVNV